MWRAVILLRQELLAEGEVKFKLVIYYFCPAGARRAALTLLAHFVIAGQTLIFVTCGSNIRERRGGVFGITR